MEIDFKTESLTPSAERETFAVCLRLQPSYLFKYMKYMFS